MNFIKYLHQVVVNDEQIFNKVLSLSIWSIQRFGELQLPRNLGLVHSDGLSKFAIKTESFLILFQLKNIKFIQLQGQTPYPHITSIS